MTRASGAGGSDDASACEPLGDDLKLMLHRPEGLHDLGIETHPPLLDGHPR